MNMIAEVKKIEQEARDLEKYYKEKLDEMEKHTGSRIVEMKDIIEKDLNAYQSEQDELKRQKLEMMKDELKLEETKEKAALSSLYDKKHSKLVDIVIEEVIKQYGNS
ncbi:hypothetical protein [Jeotgalibaca sp. A127]|uniref:hypothetical protein n=1 Tax=Jeotgalibaca sp. A127 TaxID=3457324 RepID=UPI003FD621EF